MSRPRRPLDEQAALRAVVAGTAGDTGTDFFAALVRNLATALGVEGAWVTEYLADEGRLRALAFWLGDDFVAEYEYDVEGTPCAPVLDRKELFHVPERVIELFPRDPDLPKLGAVSYMGVPLVDAAGEVLGHLAVLDTRPTPDDPRLQDLLRIFANRAVAELRRLRAEQATRERERRLALLFDSAMDAIVEIDGDGIVTRANAAGRQLFGCVRTQLAGRPVDAFLSDAGRKRLDRSMRELRSRPHEARYQWIGGGLAALQEDGTTFHAEATLSAYEEGSREFFTLILRDVNDRIAAERRIERLEQQTAYLRGEIDALRHFDRVLGASPALLSVLREVDQVAATEATVLLLGETGTGKGLIARAVHAGSPRSRAPMIDVNCAAIPENLIESELFGHERGAFTGATQRREGRFALADGGTLFLDEIGELPLALQGKLLRVLQDGAFEPVGSARTRTVDVRLIAATNRDLEAEVAAGRFREDLFYRLNVFPIRMPPLRERGDDVVELARAFARRFAEDMGKRIEPFDEPARRRLRAYPWPGNVRELQNVIERATILARSGGRLDLDRVLPAPGVTVDERPGDPGSFDLAESIRTDREIRALERANLVRALERCGWKVAGAAGAARMLGLPPSTLSSRMRSLKIRRPSSA